MSDKKVYDTKRGTKPVSVNIRQSNIHKQWPLNLFETEQISGKVSTSAKKLELAEYKDDF